MPSARSRPRLRDRILFCSSRNCWCEEHGGSVRHGSSIGRPQSADISASLRPRVLELIDIATKLNVCEFELQNLKDRVNSKRNKYGSYCCCCCSGCCVVCCRFCCRCCVRLCAVFVAVVVFVVDVVAGCVAAAVPVLGVVVVAVAVVVVVVIVAMHG
jgi:hypothetical protein